MDPDHKLDYNVFPNPCYNIMTHQLQTIIKFIKFLNLLNPNLEKVNIMADSHRLHNTGLVETCLQDDTVDWYNITYKYVCESTKINFQLCYFTEYLPICLRNSQLTKTAKDVQN